ncbi:Calcium/calmodulin-dependent protein kinase type 1 [Colletotrichum orbiculare MAFF 240422]|uniref:Calcium/calmodulin-dependent protein kinase type 1 n=1 Tax=Colletotrichum orbiculare (strain 104-T / ATCC 96160 / CBS 514.97 / LARS 414 / MAFF 240422) TaxID=1213857 RepID=A0A484FQJ9_COLOR|nr:Calcium/calmodulin-dependent protein kinase type 1 [Colletotrichum orbiculare MAFF 240422]
MLLQSDLVQESKLETSFFSQHIKHTFYRRGTSGRERRIRLQEKWERRRRLGQGAYGIVWLETCDRPARLDGPKIRAVKEIPIDSTTSEDIDYNQELEAVMKFSQKQAVHIKFLARPIPETEAKMITCQLAEGLHHMHENGFTHRDLKPGNILVVSEGPHWLVQISDFGISKRLRPEQATLGTTRRGTMGFIAPEMLSLVDDRGYPHAVDIWSLGAVLYRMLTKEFFMAANFNLLQRYTVAEIPFPTDDLNSHAATESLKRLLQSLLEPSPKKRPSALEVLSHEWIRDYADSPTNEDLSEKGNDGIMNYDHKQPVALWTASGKRISRQVAVESDAEKWNIPKYYCLDEWDPSKYPLMFFGIVFDAISLGTWMLDWVAFYEDEGVPIDKRVSATIKDISLLLEGLEDRATSANKYADDWDLPEEESKTLQDFVGR